MQAKNKTRLLVGIAVIAVGAGILFTLRNRRRVVRFSRSLVGQTEIAGNTGFTNEEFERLMKQVGWGVGDSWCVYFAKLVWYNMAPAWLRPKILKKVSGSSLQTWENLKNDQNFIVSAVPRPGDMAIWRKYDNGSPTWNGHAGIVQRLGMGNVITIEGNTSDGGLGNEGYIVAEKARPLDFNTKDGLRLLGFIRFA